MIPMDPVRMISVVEEKRSDKLSLFLNALKTRGLKIRINGAIKSHGFLAKRADTIRARSINPYHFSCTLKRASFLRQSFLKKMIRKCPA